MSRFAAILDILQANGPALVGGLWVTAKLCVIIWSAGLTFGALLGVMGARWQLAIGIPARVFSFFLSGIPILVFLFWCHWPLQRMIGVVIDPFYTAATVFSVVNIFAVADQVRHELKSFPEQYVVAARVCGLSPTETLAHVQLPIILQRVVPSMLALQVNMLQASLFASLIGVNELFRVAQWVNAQEYKPIEVYSALGVFMLMVCLPLNGVALWLRSRFERNLSER